MQHEGKKQDNPYSNKHMCTCRKIFESTFALTRHRKSTSRVCPKQFDQGCLKHFVKVYLKEEDKIVCRCGSDFSK